MAYTKLFNSIITSTIWTEDDKTRIVWITMLAMADKNGEVQGSIPGIARVAGVDTDACRSAIAKFLSPDPDSRTKDDEGRRIEEIDGGWHLLNHRKYRDMASDADRAEKAAIRQQRKRDKDKRNGTKESRNSHAIVTPKSRQNPQADTDTDTDTEERIPPNPLKGERGGKSDKTPTTPNALRIAALFHRKPSTAWSAKEIKAFKALGEIDPEDLELVCRYTESERAKGENGRHRRDLATFLNNYTGEIDRARSKPISGQSPPKPKPKQFID